MSHITDATEAVATTLQQEAANGRASYYDMAEAAIAKATTHIQAALLTPACVEAGAKAIAFVGLDGEVDDDHDAVWANAGDDGREFFREEYRAAIKAAILEVQS